MSNDPIHQFHINNVSDPIHIGALDATLLIPIECQRRLIEDVHTADSVLAVQVRLLVILTIPLQWLLQLYMLVLLTLSLLISQLHSAKLFRCGLIIM